MDGDKTTLIDEKANVEGTLKGKDAHILGRFKGEVTISGRLQIGEGSHVEAKVAADVAEIAGEFRGDVAARSVVLSEKARVSGKIDAQVLVVKDGAEMNGAVNAGSHKAKPVPGAPVPVAG